MRVLRTLGLMLFYCMVLSNIAVKGQAWQWAQKAGGDGYDYGRSIGVDKIGNSYTVGVFEGKSKFGKFTLQSAGENDIFIFKCDNRGNVKWARRAGGEADDFCKGIYVDEAGNSYIVGSFQGTANFGDYQVISKGKSDIFIAKYDADGNIMWAKSVGGEGVDEGNGICVDIKGNIYIAGSFSESIENGKEKIVSRGETDILVAKMNNGGTLLWMNSEGRRGEDAGNGISVDLLGNCYVTGNIDSMYFETGSKTRKSSIKTRDIFLAKYNTYGNLKWFNTYGGPGDDRGFGISVNNLGNIYITGYFSLSANFDTIELVSNDGWDIFIAKCDNSGKIKWAKRDGGPRHDYGVSIAVDNYGNSYIVGGYMKEVVLGKKLIKGAKGWNIFIAKYDNNGNIKWSDDVRGTKDNYGYGICIDDNGGYYITGSFKDEAGFGSKKLSSIDDEIYVAKYKGKVIKPSKKNNKEFEEEQKEKELFFIEANMLKEKFKDDSLLALTNYKDSVNFIAALNDTIKNKVIQSDTAYKKSLIVKNQSEGKIIANVNPDKKLENGIFVNQFAGTDSLKKAAIKDSVLLTIKGNKISDTTRKEEFNIEPVSSALSMGKNVAIDKDKKNEIQVNSDTVSAAVSSKKVKVGTDTMKIKKSDNVIIANINILKENKELSKKTIKKDLEIKEEPRIVKNTDFEYLGQKTLLAENKKISDTNKVLPSDYEVLPVIQSISNEIPSKINKSEINNGNKSESTNGNNELSEIIKEYLVVAGSFIKKEKADEFQTYMKGKGISCYIEYDPKTRWNYVYVYKNSNYYIAVKKYYELQKDHVYNNQLWLCVLQKEVNQLAYDSESQKFRDSIETKSNPFGKELKGKGKNILSWLKANDIKYSVNKTKSDSIISDYKEEFFLVVGSFLDSVNAKKQVRILGERGVSSYIEHNSRSKWHYVFIYKYNDIAEAINKLYQLKMENIFNKDIWIYVNN